MPALDLVISTKPSHSVRALQVSAAFDVPVHDEQTMEWHGSVPIEERDWNVGLIVGPSGSGKTQCSRQLFGADFDKRMAWSAPSVIDDFADGHSIEEIMNICSAVGFNTIPAWLRAYEVLSNGEKFRVEIARRLLEHGDPIVVDEFTSVVDRQVAKIASYAVAKFVRKTGRKFVAVSCHSDIMEWLTPDWILELPEADFRWTEEAAGEIPFDGDLRWRSQLRKYATGSGTNLHRFTI